MAWMTDREKKIFLTVLLVSGLFVQWYGVNANARFDLTLSLVNEGTASIDEYYWHAGDRSYYEGTYYSDKEPGMAFLATPIYAGWKTVYGLFGDTEIDTENRTDWFTANDETVEYMEDPGAFYLTSLILVVFLTSTLSLSILTILVYRISHEFIEDELKRVLLAFGFAFGTLVTHYGVNFMPNAVVTMLSFSSFYLVYTRDVLSTRGWVGAGFLGGFGVVVDPTAAPVLAATFLYAILKFDYIPYMYVLGGFLGGLPMMVYNTLLFGYPWMLPRFFLDPALFPNLQQTSGALPDLTSQGFRLDPTRLFYVTKKLLFFPHRGIFYWYPLLILGLIGLPELLRKRPKIAITLALTGFGIIFMVAGWWAWWMGGFFGARYLSVLIPFLMFPLFYVAEKIDLRIIALLIGISVLVNLSGFHGYYEDGLKDLENASEMKAEYQKKVQSFETLGNPVRDYYINGLMDEGPQSRMLNGLYNRDFPPDIRAYTPYEERAPLPMLLWVVGLIMAGIWWKEITENLRRHRDALVPEKK